MTEADLNNRLLQTTSSKELLAIMREIRENQAANSEVPNKSRRHLPSAPKPCAIGYQTRPPLVKRFKALINGLLGHIKGRGIASRTRGKDLHQRLWTKERRSQDQHVSDWYTCCVRLVSLSMETCGETVRARVHAGTLLAQIGTMMTGFDASNAFMSVHHTTLDKLVEASFEDEMDRSLMKQRHRGAQISLFANSGEPRVEIVPSCGCLQGDVTSPSHFNDVYSEQIAKWKDTARRRILTRSNLRAKCFFYRRHHETNCNEYPSGSDHKMGETSTLLQKFAADIGIVRTKARKNTRSVLLVLVRSRRCECCTEKGNGQTAWGNCAQHRESWVHLTYNCGNVAERQARLRAAQAEWTVMGRFSNAECPQRVKRIIFRSMVWSTLLTEWKTLLPSRADCRAFDKFTACKGRSLMRRKASGRWIDAEGKKTYHSLTTAEVLRWLKLVPTLLSSRFAANAGGRAFFWTEKATRLSLASSLADWERLSPNNHLERSSRRAPATLCPIQTSTRRVSLSHMAGGGRRGLIPTVRSSQGAGKGIQRGGERAEGAPDGTTFRVGVLHVRQWPSDGESWRDEVEWLNQLRKQLISASDVGRFLEMWNIRETHP